MSNRFVFLACHFNMSRHVGQMLMSIGAQSYTNWRVVVTDDMSDPNERNALLKYEDAFDTMFTEPGDEYRLRIVENQTKQYELLNLLTMVREHCEPDDIVCHIGADDFLIDNSALWVINHTYETQGCDALWTAHRWIDEGDRPTNVNISGELTDPNPYKSQWVSSHLKTFRASLLQGINEDNFKGRDGGYPKRAGDQALYLPILYKATKRVYLPMVTYAYRCSLAPERFHTDAALEQQADGNWFRSRGFVP